MSGAIKPYSDAPIFAQAFTLLGSNPILGILVGAGVTALIQSSSASVGILQTLAANGVVTWNSAIYITLGQNIGTCVTALISSAGANKTAKRAAIIHFLFNTVGAVVFGVLSFLLFSFNSGFASTAINSVQISVFHTVFNVTNTLLLFPFANKLVKLSGMIIKDKAETVQAPAEDEETDLLRHLDSRILESPSFAVQNAVEEVLHMSTVAYKNVELSFEAVLDNNEEKIDEVYEHEKSIDRMAKRLSDYLIKISSLSLNDKEHTLVNHLFYSVSDIERMGDHAENIAELAKYKVNNNIQFSETARKELEGIMTYVTNGLNYAIKARQEMSMEFVEKEKEYEDLVDYIESELREKHIQRLTEHRCQPASGVVFLDVLSNLERISDHADNIAGYVKHELKK